MHARFPIHQLLRDAHVAHAVVPRHSAVTAQDETADTPARRNWARVVTYFVDDEPVEAVLQAPMAVNLDRLLDLARGRGIRPARNEELRRLCPESEPQRTASDSRYRPQVIVDVALAAEDEILFDGHVPQEAIRIRWADFAARVRPIVGKFAEPHVDRVGGFRLSYRE